MWIVTDREHGCLGIIVDVTPRAFERGMYYSVLWYDGVLGKQLVKEELMRVEDEEGRQS